MLLVEGDAKDALFFHNTQKGLGLHTSLSDGISKILFGILLQQPAEGQLQDCRQFRDPLEETEHSILH